MVLENQRPVRILYLVASGEIIGGIETNLLAVLEHSQSFNIEPVGVLVPGEGKFTEMLRQHDILVRFVSYYSWRWASPWRYIQTFWQLKRWINELQPDIIHVTHQWLAEYAWGLKFLVKCPVVCDLANLESASFLKLRERYFAKLDCVIVWSMAIKENLERHTLLPVKTALIPHGIVLNNFMRLSPMPDLRTTLGLATNTQLVGFVGRLVDWKGVEDLLEAWGQVTQEQKNVQLLIVGEDAQGGAYKHFLEAKASHLRIAETVHFLGFRTDIADILKTLDAFVLPSHNEPYGIVTLEALASGCVVVATNGGGTPEIITDKDNGFLVNVQDIPDLAAGILQALRLSPVERQAMQARASASVQTRTVENQVRQLGELYRQLLTGKRPSK